MARITVEDCLEKVNNRFALIHMASKRVRQLRKGAEPTITSKNRDIVISLREIAAGKIEQAEEGNSYILMEKETDNLPQETSLVENEIKTKEPEDPKAVEDE